MLKHLLFALAVLAQVAIIWAKPAEKLYVRNVGQEITLRTRPVDPYDPALGYFMTLRYVISEPVTCLAQEKGDVVYTLLQKGKDGVWDAVGVADRPPKDLPPGQAVIRGYVAAECFDGPVRYGIERYDMPEEARQQLDHDVREAKQSILVDVKVDPQGRSSILRLHVGDKVYEY